MFNAPKNVLFRQFKAKQKADLCKEEILWKHWSTVSLISIIQEFLKTFPESTRKSYTSGFNRIVSLGLLNAQMTVSEFSLVNLENVLDNIKEHFPGTEATKQARAAIFISFTGFLSRETEGLVRKVSPCKDRSKKTFQQIRDKTVCKTLSNEEMTKFLKALKSKRERDFLIAMIQYGGGKRISEVLNARIEDIDWEQKTIKFKQLKSSVLEDSTTVLYADELMQSLRNHLGERTSGRIFPVKYQAIYNSYEKAFKEAGISINTGGVTHILKNTKITELSEDFDKRLRERIEEQNVIDYQIIHMEDEK